MSKIIQLKKSNCRNCYKCIRNCPVKSIRFSGEQAHIVEDECILCGQCLVVCPQDAKEIADSTEIVKVLLYGEEPVIASIAPSYAAYFENVGLSNLIDGLRQLGFYDGEETAVGATFVKKEYEKQLQEEGQDIIITSCCPSVNSLIQKYYPQLLKYLSPVVSPMLAHGLDIRRRKPDARIVYIGPCPAKKQEAADSCIDAVLTFEELTRMFRDKKIELRKCADKTENYREESRARLFPVAGGILKTMDIPDNGYTCLTIDGIDKCRAALEDIQDGNIHRCFIEMSACQGSCIGGPVMEKYSNFPVRHYQNVVTGAGSLDFQVEEMEENLLWNSWLPQPCRKNQPSEEQIREILRKMGKMKPEDELNCGSCGYDTCREKAAAVIEGKANISMCLPFLMEKSERFSSNILNNTPNGILVLNENYEVQQINPMAMEMLHVRDRSDVLGDHVIRILDPEPFMRVLEEKKPVKNYREYYAEFKKYLELTISHDPVTHILIGILRDVTDEENKILEKERISRQTAEIADKVVNKQVRIVQEIASLLGETAAETKIALTRLKESIEVEEKNK